MHGVLEKLSSNENGLRTNTVEGHFDAPPTVGARFEVIGEPLHPEALEDEVAVKSGISIRFRRVTTSNVVALKEVSGGYEFRTKSGTRYRVKEHVK